MSTQNPARASEVFRVFLRLGLTSFGGPVAHIGYFRKELVERRGWVSESQFTQLFAICQFLPGPASSQLGFTLGLVRAGVPGALAAFLAFTLPSALLLVAFALWVPQLSGALALAAVQGLKLVAFAVVADAVWGMARKLCPDVPRALLALMAVMVLLVLDSAAAQLLVVAMGAIAGGVFCRQGELVDAPLPPVPYGPRAGGVLLAAFGAGLLVLPLLASEDGGLVAVVGAFYQAGALVFGGGHVVLPLLEDAVVSTGWVSQQAFLAGYGAAQAIPGPMFAFSAYLGAMLPGAMGPQAPVMAMLALLAIFLPGFLLVAGVLPFWHRVAGNTNLASAIAGVNAVVVGMLGAALYDPIFVSAMLTPADGVIGIAGWLLLAVVRAPAWAVVAVCVAARMLVAVVM